MFIDPSAELSGGRGGQGRSAERRKRPVLFYLRGIVRTPSWTFSDIAIDQPTLRGTGVLLLGLAVAGALFGAGGLFPAFEGLAGVALSAAGFVVVGYAFLLFWVVMLHLIAKIFEGEASIAEELSAMTYAALALWLLVPISLLWLVSGGAQPLVMVLGVMVTTLAALRLTYIAVREANRFLGTQAILTMLAPPLGLGLLGIGTFFIVAFGTLIFA